MKTKTLYIISFIIVLLAHYSLFKGLLPEKGILWSIVIFIIDPVVFLFLLIVLLSKTSKLHKSINSIILILGLLSILSFVEYYTNTNISYIILCAAIIFRIKRIENNLFE